MTVEALLGMLSGVKRTAHGWTAKCPAHPDRNPSLRVKEGDLAILLWCWSGCDVNSICQALGISMSDLFYDAADNDREKIRQRQSERRTREARKMKIELAGGFTIDTRREAEKFLGHCRGLDPSTLSSDKFDSIMDTVFDAMVVLMEEKTHAHVG